MHGDIPSWDKGTPSQGLPAEKCPLAIAECLRSQASGKLLCKGQFTDWNKCTPLFFFQPNCFMLTLPGFPFSPPGHHHTAAEVQGMRLLVSCLAQTLFWPWGDGEIRLWHHTSANFVFAKNRQFYCNRCCQMKTLHLL